MGTNFPSLIGWEYVFRLWGKNVPIRCAQNTKASIISLDAASDTALADKVISASRLLPSTANAPLPKTWIQAYENNRHLYSSALQTRADDAIKLLRERCVDAP